MLIIDFITARDFVTRENIFFLCSLGEINLDNQQKKTIILYVITKLHTFCCFILLNKVSVAFKIESLIGSIFMFNLHLNGGKTSLFIF